MCVHFLNKNDTIFSKGAQVCTVFCRPAKGLRPQNSGQASFLVFVFNLVLLDVVQSWGSEVSDPRLNDNSCF
jgi:hypothetical protein